MSLENCTSSGNASSPTPNVLAVPPPPMFIVFLEKGAFVGPVLYGSTKADQVKKKINGLEVYNADTMDRSAFICDDDNGFQTDVVYQCLPLVGETPRYAAQCTYLERWKTLKLKEFDDVVQLLGAKTILFEEEEASEEVKNAYFRLSGCSIARFGGDASQSRGKAQSKMLKYSHSRGIAYEPVTSETVDLSKFFFQDEWRHLINSRMSRNPRSSMDERMTFDSEAIKSLEMNLKIKSAGLKAGGSYKRTIHFNHHYEIDFYCREDWPTHCKTHFKIENTL